MWMRGNKQLRLLLDWSIHNRQKIGYYFCVFFIPLLFLLMFLIINGSSFNQPYDKTGDMAANGLQILRAGSFNEFLGPYSRFEFNHIGPISFYYYAFMEKILFFIESDHGAHQLSQLLLNCAFLIACMHLIYKSFSKDKERNSLMLFIFIMISLIPLGRYTYTSLWGPNIVILPMLAFVLSTAKFAYGDLKSILFLAVSATFIVQNHIAGLIIVLPFVIIASALYLWNMKKYSLKISKKDINILIVTIIFLVIAFSFPIFEQLNSEEGNLSKIADFFLLNREIQHPFSESVEYILPFYSEPINNFVKINHYIVVSLLFIFACMNLSRKRVFLNYLILFLFSGLLFSFYGAMKVVDELHNYLFMYEYMFVALFYFVFILAILRFIKLKKFSSVLLILLVIIACFMIFKITYDDGPINVIFDDSIEKMIGVINPSYNESYRLDWGKWGVHHSQWAVAAGLAYNLQKNGYDVCVPPNWYFMFGKKLSCDGKTRIIHIHLYNSDYFTSPNISKSFSYAGFSYAGTTIIIKEPNY